MGAGRGRNTPYHHATSKSAVDGESSPTHTLSARQTATSFRPDAEPVLRVPPGTTVRFETSPEPAERLFAAGDHWLENIDVAAINAITGPVYVEGAEPGNAIAVEILDAQPGPWGWTIAAPGEGLLDGVLSQPMLRGFPIREGRILVSDRLSLPLRPMIGCLGLAPAEGKTPPATPPARRQAIALMFADLTGERGLSPEDGYILCSACVDLEFGGSASATVLARLPLDALGPSTVQ